MKNKLFDGFMEANQICDFEENPNLIGVYRDGINEGLNTAECLGILEGVGTVIVGLATPIIAHLVISKIKNKKSKE